MTVDAHGRVALFVADAQSFALWTTTATAGGKSASIHVSGLLVGSLYAPTGGIGPVGEQAAASPDSTY